MGYQQLAKLYMRGSLCNVVLKNLNDEQRHELEGIVEMVMSDPGLAQCRREFCNALARTIRSEYNDREVGEQDLRIAIMRAAVAARFSDKPAPTALTDPLQRKKWFQTWVFNYLRQILRENKIPVNRTSYKIKVSADLAAIMRVCDEIEKLIYEQSDPSYRRQLKQAYAKVRLTETNIGYSISFDHWSFPFCIIERIAVLTNEFVQHGISILCTTDGVESRRIHDDVPCIELRRTNESFVKLFSFDSGEQDEDNGSHRDQLEQGAMVMNKRSDQAVIEESESIQHLRGALPIDAVPVLNIMLEDTRPTDFIGRYGEGQPKLVHIAEYLSLPLKDVKRLRGIIKMHCLAIGLGK